MMSPFELTAMLCGSVKSPLWLPGRPNFFKAQAIEAPLFVFRRFGRADVRAAAAPRARRKGATRWQSQPRSQRSCRRVLTNGRGRAQLHVSPLRALSDVNEGTTNLLKWIAHGSPTLRARELHEQTEFSGYYFDANLPHWNPLYRR
jgi:hypothetical protein